MGLSLRFFLFMHVVFLLSFSHLAVARFRSMQPLCHDDERSALLQFKESLFFNSTFCRDPSDYPKVARWKAEEENSNCCSWYGITCSDDTGHVTRLDLANSCLYGSISSSSSLFRLVHLEWLSLACNDFNNSRIPSEIISLSMLSHLNLSYSVISGQIPPEILELSKLETLDLSRNIYLKLQKPGLKSLAEKLTNLKKLALDVVDISSSIPHVITNLSSLTYLSLVLCGLQGEFPTEIFQLPNLYHLDVRVNADLSGYLPEFDMRSSRTRFFDDIPKSIGNLNSLLYLDISGCDFRGTIPSSIGNLTQISYLDLSDNKFSGQVPSSLTNLTQLRHLGLSGIMFPGKLPTFMGNLCSLQELDISYCNLSGQTLPLVLGNLSQLNVLDMSSNNFSSRRPLSLSWISKLTKLSGLYLSHINFVGEIPSSLKNLTQLTNLDMSSNQLMGPIPNWLIKLSQLRYLLLSSNQLTGAIPTEIKNLTQLDYLDLSSNLFQGSIPNSIFKHESLTFLDLSSNNLSGIVELDTLLGSKPRFSYCLYLSSNKLSVVTKNSVSTSSHIIFQSITLGSCNLSEFPNFLQNQHQLMVLDLSSNHIHGEIPAWLLNLRNSRLQNLNLSHNLFTGFDQRLVDLPWNQLLTLDLSYNKLQGSLPIPPVSINHYLISNNNLTGNFSSWICDLEHLQALDLSNNKLSGMLPKCLGNFSIELIVLVLRNNKFHGSIPQTFTNRTKLRMIDLSSNLLEGRIPRSLASCTGLEFLNLGDNQIADIFPSWLGILLKLQVLILRSNNCYGVIKEPETNVSFPKLCIIDLSHNKFVGDLPSKYFNYWDAMKAINTSKLSYLQDELMPQSIYYKDAYNGFDSYAYSLTLRNKGQQMKYEKVSNMVIGILLSNNEFTGEIPLSIVNLKGLQNLNLSNNNLFGRIPSSLGSLKALESFDVSHNMISGKIPQQLAELTTLAYFDVSYNQLIGSVPEGTQFDTFSNSSFNGNPGLCGKYLLKKCIVEVPQEESQSCYNSPFEFDRKIVLIGYASGLVVGVVLGHVFTTTKKHEWFLMIFQIQLKRIKRKRGHGI